MFAPIAVDNIAFPESSSLSTLDFIPESFEAFQAYSNYVTSSTFSSQSFTPTPFINAIMRWGMGSDNQILGIAEGGGTIYKWNVNTDALTTHGTQSPGTVRNVVWDNLTNSWVICGSTSFVKISCADQTISSSIAVPTNSGTQYPAVVAYGGKAYAMPLVTVGAGTRVAIFDLVANTSTTSSVTVGTSGAGFWGACLTSVGTIYFAREASATNNSIYEYNPLTNSGSVFGTLSGNSGYGLVNLPNGNVAAPALSNTPGTPISIINPINKSVTIISSGTNFAYSTGICIGQNGHIYGQNTGTNPGIYGFNPNTNTGYKTAILLVNMVGNRSYQDMFSLSDGRLINMPGQSNGGRLEYFTYMNNNNNTFPTIGVVNPIMANGKGV